jgi:predicted metal-binding protein
MSAQHRLLVCTSCHTRDEQDLPRARWSGARLFESLVEQRARGPVEERMPIVPVRCLNRCDRPCCIGLKAPGKPLVLLGALPVAGAEGAILRVATRYRRSAPYQATSQPVTQGQGAPRSLRPAGPPRGARP